MSGKSNMVDLYDFQVGEMLNPYSWPPWASLSQDDKATTISNISFDELQPTLFPQTRKSQLSKPEGCTNPVKIGFVYTRAIRQALLQHAIWNNFQPSSAVLIILSTAGAEPESA